MWLHSDPVDLGMITADGGGRASITFVVPPGLESGEHTVVLTGQRSGHVAEARFAVTAPQASAGTTAASGSPSTSANGGPTTGGFEDTPTQVSATPIPIAYTGVAAGSLAALALILLTVGAGLALLARRRGSGAHH